MTALATRRAADLESRPKEHRWLVEGLWAEQAVGIVGGQPKCCKSFLALDLAVSVASGAPCLRRFHTAVLLVHHARKAAAGARGGQALRGSSELHAIGDSNLYLRRDGHRLQLAIEHRAAPSRDGVPIELRARDGALALEVVNSAPGGVAPKPPGHLERIVHVLETADAPLTVREIRRACRMNTARVSDVLGALIAEGRAIRSPSGYALAQS